MKLLIYFVKIYPIVISIFIAIGLSLSLCGVDTSNYTYPIVGHSLFSDFVILLLSYKFRFCKWHRALIFNMMFLICLEWMEVNFLVIDDVILYVRVLLLSTVCSLIFSAILYYKHGCNKTSTQKAARQGSENARRR